MKIPIIFREVDRKKFYDLLDRHTVFYQGTKFYIFQGVNRFGVFKSDAKSISEIMVFHCDGISKDYDNFKMLNCSLSEISDVSHLKEIVW